VALRSARLPDPVVGLAPDRLDVFDEHPPARPQPLLDPAARLGPDEHHPDDLAVDVELELLGSRVPDADGPGALFRSTHAP
jgi:hypothetical protein